MLAMKLTPILLLAVVSSACALTEDRIHLDYTVSRDTARIAGAENVVATVTVRDVRPDKSRVSVKKNGYGAELGAIRADTSVDSVVRSAVENELRACGFRVGKSGAVLVDIEVTRFWNDFKMGFFSGDAIADFQISVQVKGQDGRIVYVRNYSQSGEERTIQLATGPNAQLALDRALQNGIHDLFADSAFLKALVPGSS
jgi:uncharacterized lipoprotein YajG